MNDDTPETFTIPSFAGSGLPKHPLIENTYAAVLRAASSDRDVNGLENALKSAAAYGNTAEPEAYAAHLLFFSPLLRAPSAEIAAFSSPRVAAIAADLSQISLASKYFPDHVPGLAFGAEDHVVKQVVIASTLFITDK